MQQLIIIIAAVLWFQPLNEVKTQAISVEDGTYEVSAKDSKIEWQAYKVTGQHNGTVQLKEGDLKFDDNELKGGTFTVDMPSITVLDLSGDNKAKLEGHLKSPDFFGVEKYETAIFVITDAFPVGTSGKYRIKGDMTIKENTNPVSFNAMLKDDGSMITATADFKIDRAKYNVRYGSGSFFDNLGDKTIYDEFDLSVTLKTKKK